MQRSILILFFNGNQKCTYIQHRIEGKKKKKKKKKDEGRRRRKKEGQNLEIAFSAMVILG